MTPPVARAALASLQTSGPARDDLLTALAYDVVEPARLSAPLVSASPHSGRLYPAEMTDRSRLDFEAIRRSEDAWVDDLAGAAPAHGWPLIAARYARAYVDLNRAPYELDVAMFDGRPAQPCTRTPRAAAGLGSAPLVVGEGAPIYAQRLHFTEVEARLARVHAPYHAELERLLARAEAAFGCAVLLDWHSMPSAAAPGPDAPDVVIGDLHGRACAPKIAALVEGAFKALGYATARNRPYAGGYGTERHGRPRARRHALQIELRRDLYLREPTRERSAGFARLKADLGTVCAALAGADWAALA